jgi:hypothetical protein
MKCLPWYRARVYLRCRITAYNTGGIKMKEVYYIGLDVHGEQ